MQVRTRIAAAIVLGTGLTTGWVTVAQGTSGETAPVPEATKPASPENGVCRKTFASGAGLTRFVWCFGADGSINQIEHPAGQEHTGSTEGFCLASSSNGSFVTHGQVFGDNPRAGLNPPTYPAANKVVHTTTDGAFRIEQTFTQVPATKSVVIAMKVTNTSGSARQDVTLTRWIDADQAGTPSNDVFYASSRSAVVIEPKIGISGGSRLEILAPSMGTISAWSLIFSSFRPELTLCHNEGALTTSNSTGDRSVGAEYVLGPIGAGASKTVEFVYRSNL